MASSHQTLVFYMGLVSVPQICAQLIAHGKAADTPAALIERGTTPNHCVHIGTISTLPTLVANTPIQAPTLLIIGSVVFLDTKLGWYKAAP